jgi:hypothetical protein
MSSRNQGIAIIDCDEQLESYFSDDLISEVAPTDYHQNNASLFKLARSVKSYEQSIGRAATQRELEFVFDRWSSVADGFWRKGSTRDDYYAEFLDCYHYAHTALNIEVAVSLAKAAPLPEVQGFTNERIRLLVSICREMQQITGADPFFLPTRKLGEILDVHYSQVARWLRALEVLQIIHLPRGEVRTRGGNRCPRYYYGQPVRETNASVVTTPLASSKPAPLKNGSDGHNVADTNQGDSGELSVERNHVAEWLARRSRQ